LLGVAGRRGALMHKSTRAPCGTCPPPPGLATVSRKNEAAQYGRRTSMVTRGRAGGGGSREVPEVLPAARRSSFPRRRGWGGAGDGRRRFGQVAGAWGTGVTGVWWLRGGEVCCLHGRWGGCGPRGDQVWPTARRGQVRPTARGGEIKRHARASAGGARGALQAAHEGKGRRCAGSSDGCWRSGEIGQQ
jgi:hypothetical protein